MKIGVISDAHGNLQGFNASLKKIKHADKLIFVGDLFGYYFDSLSILKIIRQNNFMCILGNHDIYFLSYLGIKFDNIKIPLLSDYLQKYGPSFSIIKNKISSEDVDWLRSLPTEISIEFENKKFLIVHGSPWNLVNEYIYPNYTNWEKFKNIQANVVIMGHTHYPLIKDLGYTTIFNPGSCGQPRDKDLRSSCGMIEIKNNNIFYNIYRTKYLYNKVLKQCNDFAPDCVLLTKFFKDNYE